MSGVRVVLPSGDFIALPAVAEVALAMHESRATGVPWSSLTDPQRLQLIGRVMDVYGGISGAMRGAQLPPLKSGWRRLLLMLAGVT